MAVKNALMIFNILKIVGIFSFIASCGSCFACNASLKTEYGAEEFYVKPGGGIGYGAKSSTSGGGGFALVSVISGVVFLISAVGAAIYHDDAKIEESNQQKTAPINNRFEKLQSSGTVKLPKPNIQRKKDLSKFFLLPDYKLIEQFVRKNTEKEMKDDLPKLRLLLESKGWEITQSELEDLIRSEREKQNIETAKARILRNNPETLEEILKTYLVYYKPYDIELKALKQILEEREMSFADSGVLKTELEKVKKEIEIEQFEKRLLDEN